ncbi:MAG TPA: hypothetical protein VK871_01195 [Candidatus Limnocylindrales bacterium]|nr:hypothetical protein [Candidatus Limnocylindrales bacterium]
MKKLAAAATAALVMLLLLAAPASARPYYDKPTCAASDSTVAPGDTVTVSGTFWEPGSQIDIILRPGQILLGTATADGQGSFSIVVTIPEDLRPGRYKIFCRGRDQRGDVKVKNTAITVLGETVTPPAGAAFTGATTNVPLWAGLAGVLALAGVTALFAARLRRRRAGPDLSP